MKTETFEDIKLKSLYHYCSIDTLEAILTTKTLRFTSLEKVDDLEEAEVYGLGRMGRITFVSCWTDSSDELIPMWREYTPRSSSIRIEIASGLFDNLDSDSSMAIAKMLQEQNDIQISPPYKPISFPITYTKDPILLNTRILSTTQNKCECGRTSTNYHMNTGYIGRFKSLAWENQAEYRFALTALPMEFYRRYQSGEFLQPGISHEQILQNEQKAMLDTPFVSSYIDYPIDLSAFMPISITMSPMSDPDDYKRVQQLVDKFELSSSVYSSDLKIR